MNVQVYFSPETLSNSYIVYMEGARESILIDPHSFDLPLFSLLEARKLEVSVILLTHANSQINHAIRTIRKIYDPEIYAGTDMLENLFISNVRTLDEFMAAGLLVQPLSMAGHHTDATIYMIGDCLFSGDIMSAGSITKADGSYGRALLIHSLRELLSKLPNSTTILPLSGPPSTLGIEKCTNLDLRYTIKD